MWFTDKPDIVANSGYRYIQEGAIAIDGGKIIASGQATDISANYPDAAVSDYGHGLIMPGFIDTHIHFPQCGVIASYGEQLLDWLENYTFPSELAFADDHHAKTVATLFVNELFKNGTTTAMVYGTVHPESVNAFFSEANKYKARMMCGKVMMDRNAPELLLDTAISGYEKSAELIEQWHAKDRLGYIVTPRFAPTSTAEQLAFSGRLLQEYPGVYMQTHISENLGEVAWVQALYPHAKDYLDVYDQAGLLGPRSVFGHGIHLSDDEHKRLAETGSSVAFCPTSNLFLGSGLLDVHRIESAGVSVSIATDVGGGTSFSMLTTLGEAYKIMQLQQQKLHAFDGFYRITLGNAITLGLDDCLGKLEPGYEADFVVLNNAPTTISEYRNSLCSDLAEELFIAQTLGDDRWIHATWVNGENVFTQPESDI